MSIVGAEAVFLGLVGTIEERVKLRELYEKVHHTCVIFLNGHSHSSSMRVLYFLALR